MKIEGYFAITYSKMFGLFCDDMEMKQIKFFDVNDYKTIVFDEAFLYTPLRLKRLSNLMNKYQKFLFLMEIHLNDRR